RDFPYSLDVADFNGDGFDDLVSGADGNTDGESGNGNRVAVMMNNGDGSFSASVRILVGLRPRYASAADFDGDGDFDIAVANRNSDSFNFLLNESPPRQLENFLERVCTPRDFRELSRPSRVGPIDGTLKFTLPARDDPDLLPTLYQNSRRFDLHEDFLTTVFPEKFSALSIEEFDQLVGRRETRSYYVGTISRIRTGAGYVYGFSGFADLRDSGEVLGLEEVRGIFEALSATFTAGPLAYQPLAEIEKREAATWTDPGFEVIDVDTSGVEFVSYTVAVGYGRVRLFTPEDFEAANEPGLFTFQDIIVLEDAPRDVEGVVGGVITGKIQNELSHISVRTSRRGTPNAFVAGAREIFGAWEAKLVRLEVKLDDYSVAAATIEEAQKFWDENRPKLDDLPPVDTDYAALDSLLEIDLSLAAPVTRYGGKAANFARLQHVLDGDFAPYRENGFAVPMRHYLEFMQSNVMPSAFDAGRQVTYQEHLDELLAAARFQTDSKFRFESLDSFRDFIRDNGEVPEALVGSAALRVGEVFGDTLPRVRCRSSSSVEDLLDFNGAGLYQSTSACAADDLDDDTAGPSLCDAEREDERGFVRGLKKVWSSLWTFRAVEERAYYQIPHQDAAMGVLVSRAFPGELANGVAFTGNPVNPLDRRFMITSQAG
ncbi:MAG: FG-GAP repeat protein, partial [Planctomycetes bacterium]|nr:FG-GAP repeat protein [Planctomycetota bacterium]